MDGEGATEQSTPTASPPLPESPIPQRPPSLISPRINYDKSSPPPQPPPRLCLNEEAVANPFSGYGAFDLPWQEGRADQASDGASGASVSSWEGQKMSVRARPQEGGRYLTDLTWQGMVFLVVMVPLGLMLFILLVAYSVMNRFHSHASLFVAYCTSGSIVLTLWLVFNHLRHFHYPEEQRRIIRILFLVPLYAIDGMFGSLYPKAALYLDLVRDMYEAYVLYNFFGLLISFIGGERKCIILLRQKGSMAHLPPLCWLPPIRLGGRFLFYIKMLMMQFVVIKPISTFFGLILSSLGLYGSGKLTDWRLGYMYLTILETISISLTISALLYFYTAIGDALKPFSIEQKFVSIKAIIAVSFWQGIIINILVKNKIVQAETWETPSELSAELQDFLICVEMLLLAIWHHWTFGYGLYAGREGEENRQSAERVKEEYIAGVDWVEDAEVDAEWTAYHKYDRPSRTTSESGSQDESAEHRIPYDPLRAQFPEGEEGEPGHRPREPDLSRPYRPGPSTGVGMGGALREALSVEDVKTDVMGFLNFTKTRVAGIGSGGGSQTHQSPDRRRTGN